MSTDDDEIDQIERAPDVDKLARDVVAAAGDDLVRKLLAWGGTPLKEHLLRKLSRYFLLALQRGNLQLVKFCVENGININDKTVNNRWPIVEVSIYGNIDVMKYLLEHGANLHIEQDLAFRVACVFGRLEIAQFILSQEGVDVRGSDDEALMGAVENGRVEIVQWLLQMGANLHARDGMALTVAADSDSDSLTMVHFLLEHGLLDTKGDALSAALSSGTSYVNIELVQLLLLEAGSTVSDYDLAQHAIHHREPEIGRLMIEKGADANEALLEVAKYGSIHAVQFLHDLSADLEYQSCQALINACAFGNWNIVNYLLDRGADINTQNGIILNSANGMKLKRLTARRARRLLYY